MSIPWEQMEGLDLEVLVGVLPILWRVVPDR